MLLAAPHGPVLRLLTVLGVPGAHASVAAAADSAGPVTGYDVYRDALNTPALVVSISRRMPLASLTMTTVSASDGKRSRWLSTVVLPLPRNPVMIVTGTVFAA